MRKLSAALCALLLMLGPLCRSASAESPAPTPSVPILAYFYQWFDDSSWNRAKTDYPLAGRYSSDDLDVMRRQIKQAQGAGIDGFIVSWKRSELNDRRLQRLMGVARESNFKLAIIYQ